MSKKTKKPGSIVCPTQSRTRWQVGHYTLLQSQGHVKKLCPTVVASLMLRLLLAYLGKKKKKKKKREEKNSFQKPGYTVSMMLV